METVEASFLEFIHTRRFGICSTDTRKSELIELFPDIWISGKEIDPPYTLLIYENLEFVFEYEEFDRVRIWWGDGSDIKLWTRLFDVAWYGFIEKFDAETMQNFLKKHGIAHSSYYFSDDSVAIEIPQSAILFAFAETIDKLYLYYRKFSSFRGSPAPDKAIDYAP
jgi:hypothetical protein